MRISDWSSDVCSSDLEAAHLAMKEVSGPIAAIALVLCAVFVPMAFLSGVTGEFYKQFAVTIAISTVLSAINSLTLSPALAACMLKPHFAPTYPPTQPLDCTFEIRIASCRAQVF